MAAAEKRYRVNYTLATRLVTELVEAADEKMLAKEFVNPSEFKEGRRPGRSMRPRVDLTHAARL